MKLEKFVEQISNQKASPLAMKHYAGIIVNNRIVCMATNQYGSHAENEVLSRFEGKDRQRQR